MSLAETIDGIAPAVAEVLLGLEARDTHRVTRALLPDVRWVMIGGGPRFPLGGAKTLGELTAILDATLGGFEDFHFEVLGWAQNGDTVFAETITRATGPGPAVYDNIYLMRFTLKGGLIADVLEHYDPFRALDYVEQLQG